MCTFFREVIIKAIFAEWQRACQLPGQNLLCGEADAVQLIDGHVYGLQTIQLTSNCSRGCAEIIKWCAHTAVKAHKDYIAESAMQR